MKKSGCAVLAFMLALATGSAYAEQGRPYAGVQAGMFLPIRSSVSGELIGNDSRFTYNPGFALLAAGGYDFRNGFRTDAEFSYRRLTTDRLIVGETISYPLHCDVSTYAFMANLYYDFRNSTRITPYMGAGAGAAVATFGTGKSNGRTLWSADTDLSVAYQGIAGFAIRLSDDTSVDFSYHHFAIPRLHFETLSAQFRGPSVTLGIRHGF